MSDEHGAVSFEAEISGSEMTRLMCCEVERRVLTEASGAVVENFGHYLVKVYRGCWISLVS